MLELRVMAKGLNSLEMEERIFQMQEELRRVEEERCQAILNLEEIKWKVYSESENRMHALEAEAQEAKESERRMLESLTCQTKQLEETKILLEEAKLEIVSLSKAIQVIETSSSAGGGRMLEKCATTVIARGYEEIGVLRAELKLAIEAEEKSKTAMDDLALALKEVTTESNSVKEKLFKAQSELDKTRDERNRLKAALKQVEAKLRAATDDSKRLKMEADESFAAWNEKENGFLECIKMCEEEISSLKEESNLLLESQRSAKEEVSKLRDILKQAINEATVVKEALEIARTENSQLKDMLSEKDDALQSMKQELECIKASEAAALDSVKELQSLLVATSTLDLSRPSRPTFEKDSSPEDGALRRSKPMAKFPSEKWKGRDHDRQLSKVRRLSLGESDRFEGSILDMVGSPEQSNNDQSMAFVERKPGKTMSLSDHPNHVDEKQLDGAESGWESPTRQRKKRLLRRMGELLMRRNLQK